MVGALTGLDNRPVRPAPSRRSDSTVPRTVLPQVLDEQPVHSNSVLRHRGLGPDARKDAPWAAKRRGNATTEDPSYLRTAEVADILYASPKTVSRWAKEGKLPFLKTLGGHRRYPEAEIRELANQLREEATA
jgi:excisionase family DNA binding protein